MRCGPNRIFEASFKACVLNGTTRSMKRENESQTPRIIDTKPPSNFNCTKRKPGKYADNNDCHVYHICLQPKLYAPFEHLLVECPRTTAYDASKKKCSKRALRRCETKISCETEMRFRETRTCSRYFLCYRNQMIQFSCPKGFEFDENLQFCERARFVKCE